MCLGNSALVCARVYCTADKFLIGALKEDSLAVIRTLLLIRVFPEERISELEALRIVYNETCSPELKELFLFAICCNIDRGKLDETRRNSSLLSRQYRTSPGTCSV
jgi:hypothetical protein